MTNDMSGDRILALFTALLLQLAGLGVLFFWAMGAILKVTKNGGQILDIQLSGLPLATFNFFPVILVIFSIIGWLAFWRKVDLVAVGALSVPAGIMLLLYLYLVMFA